MSGPRDNGRNRGTPSDPRLLRADIEQTRAEVGNTLEELSARTDVRRQARQTVAGAAGRARERLSGGSAALRHRGTELRDRVAESAGPAGGRVREAVPDRAGELARRTGDTARQNPRQLAFAALAVLAFGWLIRRRHH
ncbi:MAG TPA: DUF3618 domain-containing protein [Mycobacteriales bacterium]|jgi:Protein of unknown function (DUF3618).